MPGQHVGSSFDDFLKDEGIRDEVISSATERVRAWLAQQNAQAGTDKTVPYEDESSGAPGAKGPG